MCIRDSVNTDATLAIVNPTGTAKGTTSTSVADTRAQAELKAAQNDTMKKKCAEKAPGSSAMGPT